MSHLNIFVTTHLWYKNLNLCLRLYVCTFQIGFQLLIKIYWWFKLRFKLWFSCYWKAEIKLEFFFYIFNLLKLKISFNASLWKKVYIVLNLSADRSVCIPSDVRSISFDLKVAKLDTVDATRGLDDPNWCSSHIVKGQGQTAVLWKKTFR